jgi:hypothetical protein
MKLKEYRKAMLVLNFRLELRRCNKCILIYFVLCYSYSVAAAPASELRQDNGRAGYRSDL